MLEAGAQLGAYTIVRPLGAGGMGVVYLARHRHIGRDAAIKVLLPEMTRNEEIVARFLTEARATAVVRHPGIVEILDCDIDPTGRAFIVMEYLRGESLAQCLTRNRSALSDIGSLVAIGGQVADALAAAHAAGIVHRDLKPDNLFLTSDGQPNAALLVKIVDFGIAKLISGDAGDGVKKTRIGSMLGTPAYMSPEQARDSSTIDHRADIYALGCILFEIAAGRPPFVRPGAGEVMVAHIVETPPRLASLVPGVSPALDQLVAQMLEKDPAARPQSMVEVLERIDALTGGRVAVLASAFLPQSEDWQANASAPSAMTRPAPVAPPIWTPSVAGPRVVTPAPAAAPRPVTPQPSSPWRTAVPQPIAPAPSRPVPATVAPTPSRAVAAPAAPARAAGPSMSLLVGSTRVLPTTNSTTMSESAGEVTSRDDDDDADDEQEDDALPARSARPTRPAKAAPNRRPIVIAAASVAGLAVIVLIATVALTGPSSPRPHAPVAAAPAPPPPVAQPVPPPPEPEPAPPPPPAPVAPAAPAVPAAPATIQVVSQPIGAEVWVEGGTAARGHTPFRVELPPSAAPVRLFLKARGYNDGFVDLRPDAPGTVTVRLEKIAAHEHKAAERSPAEKSPVEKSSKGISDKSSKGVGGKSSKGTGYKMMGD